MNVIKTIIEGIGNIAVSTKEVLINGESVFDFGSKPDLVIQLEFVNSPNLNITGARTLIIKGDVKGNVITDGNVTCNDVDGSVKAAGNVNCDDVGGSVISGGNVSSDRVNGDIRAKGNINCDLVGGDVLAGGNVTCDEVIGEVNARA